MNRNLGSSLKALRESKGIDQDSLAVSCGCTRSAISNYESGKREVPVEKLKAIARHLEVDPLDLLEIQIKDQISFSISRFKESR